LLVGAYGFNSADDAYTFITNALRSGVYSGAFDDLLHQIESVTNGPFAATTSSFIDFAVASSAPSQQIKENSVNVGGSAGALETNAMWGVVAAVLGCIFLCLTVAVAMYLYRRSSANGNEKMKALAGFKRHDGDDMDLAEGELAPEHGDLVDQFDVEPAMSRRNDVVQRGEMNKHYVFM
jgi:hypothetical protein